ncbi:hypothetical protein F5141DRAFT_1103144 [Pisolithus sp. B1]|nr:hypothetical protein F5141DRAFT_1103144 [Pisolithus sp. B1]
MSPPKDWWFLCSDFHCCCLRRASPRLMAGPYRTSSQDHHTTNNRLHLRVHTRLRSNEILTAVFAMTILPLMFSWFLCMHFTTHLNLCAKTLSLRGERDYLMQIVCEATPSPLVAVFKLREPSGVVKIMILHYDKMTFYAEQVLFWL